MDTIYRTTRTFKIGIINITGTEKGILSVDFEDEAVTPTYEIPACLAPCVRQLNEYFQRKRKIFTIPLLLHGTAFERRVWDALPGIPWGQTRSYADIARTVGCPAAFRAVGNANRKNPIAILIPCHRVIGGNGSLTGYAGGLWRKQWLLEHEGWVP